MRHCALRCFAPRCDRHLRCIMAAATAPPSMKQALNGFYNRWQAKPALSFAPSLQPEGGVVCTLALPAVETTHGGIEAHTVTATAATRKLADAAACQDGWTWLQVRALGRQAEASACCFRLEETLPAAILHVHDCLAWTMSSIGSRCQPVSVQARLYGHTCEATAVLCRVGLECWIT